jgi:hypothetical protein
MTKSSLIQPQINSDLKSKTILTLDFFNVQKQNELQGNSTHISYFDESSIFQETDSETKFEYMRVSIPISNYSYLDYSKYMFDLKDFKFNREEINER